MSKPAPLPLTRKTVFQLFLLVILVPMLPLILSQHWDRWPGWAFAIIFGGGFVASRVATARRHPDLLAERVQGFDHPNMKAWDRPLVTIVALAIVVIPLVAGLDLRFGWSEGYDPATATRVAALVVMIVGYWIGTWALIENRFFSGVVRIQTDRGHHVVTSGPYRWVRHPGYVGGILSYLGMPALLGAAWAFAPALIASGVLVYRTRLEDATLQDELAGYAEYAQATRWRLLPGLW
jgi:protein-S-isoprenylcysteine O-methyltransferase Ste14